MSSYGLISYFFLVLINIPIHDFHNLFVHSSVEGQMLAFQVWKLMNKAAIDIHGQVFVET